MQYRLTSEFIKLSETSAILYVAQGVGVEISTDSSPIKGTGFTLKTSEKIGISANKIYARSLRFDAILNSVPITRLYPNASEIPDSVLMETIADVKNGVENCIADN